MSHPPWKQDVFVSFVKDRHGETFISNLFKRLHQVGIGHFGDDKREGAAKNEAKRLNAICQQTFAFALVVFSKKYVDSAPCQNELVAILNCQKDPKLVVIPIFYIDRAGVSKLVRFKEAYAQEKWSALSKAGYELKAAKGDESKLIDIIVERLVNEIHSRYSGKDFTFGPFGGEGQNNWELVDIEKTDERGTYRKVIHVKYGDFIESVTFKVPRTTSFKPQNDGKSPFMVQLEKGEYITSFSGYLEKAEDVYIGINSLTFRTNKRILGPTDKMKLKGEFFSVPSKGGKVMKIWVSGNNGYLTSIGARVKLQSEKSCSASVQSVGLIGSKMGDKWDDGNRHTDVRKIIYELDSGGERFIRSIAFEYQKEDGGTWRSETHGVMGGKKEEKPIKMDTGEYLTLISGYRTKDRIDGFGICIKLLTFLTNKNRAITIGYNEGIDEKRYSFIRLPTDGKIVGFYGWAFGKLRGIGAYFEREPFAGGEAGEDRKFDGVREIYVLPDQSGIRYIRFGCDDGSEEGIQHFCGDWNGEVSPQEGQVQLKDYPREYLTSISGYVGEDGAIKSLTFYSNRGTHGPHGKEGDGKYFWYPSTGSRITGFYGTKGETLKSIGVYAEPIPYMYPSKILGPFGGSRGEEWDDGVHTNVRGFRVTTSGANEKEKIESITFMYDDNGFLVEGSPHGKQDVSSGKWVWLDFPYERLTSIGVWKGSIERVTIIRGLIITTIRGTSTDYETYTCGQCTTDPKKPAEEFTIKKDGHKIVGFFGRKRDSHLISIGAHLEEN